MSKFFFLIGSIIALCDGVALLTIYENSFGYMGLIASVLLMGFIFISDSLSI